MNGSALSPRVGALALVALFAGGVPAAIGCQWIARLDDRSVYAGGDSGSVAPPAADPDLTNCKLPSSGNASVRFADLVTSTDRFDVCLRPSSVDSFSAVKPLFSGAGPTCGSGLAYEVVTTPVAIPADTYDVKVLKAGTTTCDGEGVATLSQVLLADGVTTSLALFGNGQGAPTLRRFDESRPKEVGATALRLLHAAPDLGLLDFGLGANPKLPSQMVSTRITGVPYQDVRPSKPTPNIDANGYTVIQLSNSTLPYVISNAGSKDAILALLRRTTAGSSYSFFVVGRSDVPDFPLEIFACDEGRTAGTLARCSDALPLNVTVDTLNLQLSGALSPAEAARRPVAIAAAGALDGDIACITEAFQDDDKRAIIQAAKARLPYSYFLPTTFDSLPSDPRSLAGRVPPSPSGTSCGKEQLEGMNALVNCARDKCSTVPGSEDARATVSESAGTCLLNQCAVRNISLFTGPLGAACGQCVLTQYQSYEPMKEIRDLCANNPKARSSFRGSNGSLLLSRYPFLATDGFVFPPLFFWTPGALHAKLRVDNGAELDVFCGATSSVLEDCTLAPNPLPSFYGERPDGTPPTDCKEGTTNSQRLLHSQLRDWVRTTAGAAGGKIVLSGDFYSGPSLGGAVVALHADNFGLLADRFSLGIPAGFTPVCFFCDGNPLRAPADAAKTLDGAWTRWNLLQNIPVTAVRSLSRTADATALEADVGVGDRRAIPISQYYGLRTVLRIAP